MKGCKNIWVFNHYAITPDLLGITQHFDFAKELTNRSYTVTIFASSFTHVIFEERKIQDGRTWKIENYEGVNFVWIRNNMSEEEREQMGENVRRAVEEMYN